MSTTIRTTSSGALAQLDVDGLSLLQYPANEFEAGPANLWLRTRSSRGVVVAAPLTGPACGGEVRGDVVRVQCGDLVAQTCTSAADSPGVLARHWRVRNLGGRPVTVDLLCTLDVALTRFEELRRSEAYVSQYLDVSPVGSRTDVALAVRQNMPGTPNPWCALGSSEPVAGWSTDALQLLDRARGRGLDPTLELPSERLQHEHTLVGLQTEPIVLGPGEERDGMFWIVVEETHPAATGPADVALLQRRLAQATWPEVGWMDDRSPAGGSAHEGDVAPVCATAYAPALRALVVDEPLPADVALAESSPDGTVWSGFEGTDLVVAAAKERAVLRPHGRVLHFAPSANADEHHLASTVWMAGCFASHLTLGNASADERLDIRRSYLGLLEAAGVRVLVRRLGGPWHLLDVPTTWRTGDTGAVWRYVLAADLSGTTVLVSARLADNHTVRLELGRHGTPVELLVVLHEAHAGVQVDTDGQLGSDALLFADGRARGLARTVWSPAAHLVVSLATGEGEATTRRVEWAVPELHHHDQAGMVTTWLANLAQDAAVHYQAPRGLEQFTGGAWGTRDVCQGPVGLLLAVGRHDALRDTLLRVFAGQQDDGDWPQWFEYLAASARPGHRESHGDVVYWPLLALGEYLQVTGDASILDEAVRHVGAEDFLPPAPVREHVERALSVITARRTADPRLPAYGHGDWNDSLQPARAELAHEMCSTWTTELEVQAADTLGRALSGCWPDMSRRLLDLADATRSALLEVLLADGELAGYALVGERVELLVHPRDTRTGLTHGLLQSVHAIKDELLAPADAERLLGVIEEHLSGPTGAYLFDRPVAYHGGVLEMFRRAEAATFWGREIGLMYTHAQVRYVEALLQAGRGDTAWEQLLTMMPIGLSERVPGAAPRQSNCYYSSSDAGFRDREDAEAHATALFDARTRFEGGWRTYSSGPGLVLRLVTESLLGLRHRAHGLEVDPVLPAHCDQLAADLTLAGRRIRVRYHVGPVGCGVRRVLVDGRDARTEPLSSRYREAGVRLAPDQAGPRESLEVWVN